MDSFDYDVVVIGSGFGGSVAALRLTEKGYRVAVLEAGRRFDDPAESAPDRRHRALPRTSWRLRRYLWAPAIGLTGIQRIHLLRGARGSRVLVLAGSGVGGGSLNYANTLYRPPAEFFTDPQWGHLTDWRAELTPHYERAEQMLGVRPVPVLTAADRALRAVAERMGRPWAFRLTPVGGCFTAAPGRRVADPYFGGAGPDRAGCLQCGSCMTGCRHGAKNMLTENYLYLAERAGARILPRSAVRAVEPRSDGYLLTITRPGPVPRPARQVTARQVIVAAGTYGTLRLLLRMRATGRLPRLSDRLGAATRTNSEAILGAERPGLAGPDYSAGVAITSSFHPDDHTHVEATRYGRGSNAMGLLRTILVDGGGRARWAAFARTVAASPGLLARLANLRHWSQRTIIALVMQSRDNSITVTARHGALGWRLQAGPGYGEPNPTWIPQGHEVARALADEIGGMAAGSWLDLFDIPATAHLIGGCTIGATAHDGVIDGYHRVHGHPGLHVLGGAAVSANLGVNPALTITAMAERAIALWPNRGAADPRPAPGEPYRRIDPVPPRHPATPGRPENRDR